MIVRTWLEYSESVLSLCHQHYGAHLINLRKIRDLFLLLALVAVLVVAVVLSRARLFQISSCCTEGRSCSGNERATAEVAFSAPILVPGFVAGLTTDTIQKTARTGLSVAALKTIHTAHSQRVWRYAPKTSPPSFLA